MKPVNDNTYIAGKKHVDGKRLRADGTPWTSTSEVLSTVILGDRVESQEFYIVDKLWWLKGGVADVNLIEKLEGGGSTELVTKFTSTPTYTLEFGKIIIPANQTWLIDSIPYTNPVASEILFDFASTDASYFLSVVATKSNNFIGKFGSESMTNPAEPIIDEANELFLTTFLISDSTIDLITPPVSPNIYVEKAFSEPQIHIGSVPAGSIGMGKKAILVIAGTVPSVECVIKNNSNDYYIGQPFYTINKTPNPVKFTHLSVVIGSNPGSIGWYSPEEEDYYALPNEATLWVLDYIGAQKIHRRVSSYIDRDNVVYRSGTEVGKPIFGFLKFAQGVGIKTTETEEGLFTIFYNNNGLWTIIIDDGIDNPEFTFIPTKGFIADKLFDLENDENAYLQKGHIVQLEEDVFNLELNKADLVGGLVPSSQLPAYVDDILEFSNLASFPAVGEIGKIYIAISPSNLQYRWTGSAYAAITNGFIASTDDVPEGSNLYFTTARVLATVLTGISFLTGGAIVSTDSVLVAFGKVQKQLNDFGTAIGLKQDTLTDTNFGTFTNSVENKETQANTDVLGYIDVTTGKWVKQTFSKLVDYLKGFFVDKTTDQTIEGVKTFTASPIVPTATTSGQAINLGQFNASKSLHSILIDNNVGDVVQLTGTTVYTIVKSYVLPAGFFTSDCVFETDLTITKTGTAGNIIIIFGIVPSGTTLPIHNVNAGASSQYINIGRKPTMIKNGKIVGFGNSGTFYSDKIANGAIMNKASTFDPTIDNVFNLSIQLGNASDIALLENLTIKVYKNA